MFNFFWWLRFLSLWINSQPGVAYESVAYKKPCNVMLFWFPKDCVYPIFHWSDIVKKCQKCRVWKKIESGCRGVWRRVQTFWTLSNLSYKYLRILQLIFQQVTTCSKLGIDTLYYCTEWVQGQLKRHKNDTKRYDSGADVFMLNPDYIQYINISLFNKVQTGSLFFPYISMKFGNDIDDIPWI